MKFTAEACWGAVGRRTLLLVMILLLLLLLQPLHHSSFITGWALAITLFLLALFTLRKRFPFLPLGRVAYWKKAHSTFGLLSLVLFLFHIDLRIPHGTLELLLAGLYSTIVISGLLGLVFAQILPRRLRQFEQEIIFERIPAYIEQARMQVEQLIQEAVEHSGSLSLPTFYQQVLRLFFAGPSHFLCHLFQLRPPERTLLDKMSVLGRVASSKDQQVIAAIAELVKSKAELDRQYALQATLKYWLFFHMPLTLVLLMVVLVHMLLVHSFSGAL